MFKFEFKEAAAVLLVLGTLSLGVALIGTNPLRPSDTLSLWIRIAFAVLGLGLFAVTLFLRSRPETPAQPRAVTPSANNEYEESFKKAQDEFASIIPESKLLAECQIGKAVLQIVSDNIVDSKADVVVSSDDNHFTARGGVAKAIGAKAGDEVDKELAHFRHHKFRQGQLAVTTGGSSAWRAILHTAVIDLDESRYPSPDVIRAIVRRCLLCAEAIGAQRVAFPILGGGTASKHMTPQESADAMIKTIIASLKQQSQTDGFSYVALYAFRSTDADKAIIRLNKVKSEIAASGATSAPKN
jgi:O-acetyl-ADP-ribose deacetylase (regulator of RNase III)